MNVVVSEHQVA